MSIRGGSLSLPDGSALGVGVFVGVSRFRYVDLTDLGLTTSNIGMQAIAFLPNVRIGQRRILIKETS